MGMVTLREEEKEEAEASWMSCVPFFAGMVFEGTKRWGNGASTSFSFVVLSR
jgi:hypothetical protein